MDEPLSNLDAKLRVSTRAQIKNLSHELKVTTIYVTHDQVEAMTLADRVVVMNAGVVQQVGTPTNIYDKPANAFVAGFIGSPAMNLINGNIKNGVFTSTFINIKGFNNIDGPVTLGFRAEDSSISEKKGAELVAPVYSMELLGESTMVTIKSGKSLISVKAGKEYRVEIGNEVSISIPIGICHLFNLETGERIRA
jgi:multiple sugar transport system ATP-binding protein